MRYSEWEQNVSTSITADSLWQMRAYRFALFLVDVGWLDTANLLGEARTRSVADQLYRALGSIGANLAEGYSRGTGKDRARFYEYALGSARESRQWYYEAHYVLGETVTEHRLNMLSEVIRLLLTMIPQQRAGAIREISAAYSTFEQLDHLDYLAQNVPIAGDDSKLRK